MKKGFTFSKEQGEQQVFPAETKKTEDINLKLFRLNSWASNILIQEIGSKKERIKLSWYRKLYHNHDELTLSDYERTVKNMMIRWAHIQSRDKMMDELGEEIYTQVSEQEEAEYWGQHEMV